MVVNFSPNLRLALLIEVVLMKKSVYMSFIWEIQIQKIIIKNLHWLKEIKWKCASFWLIQAGGDTKHKIPIYLGLDWITTFFYRFKQFLYGIQGRTGPAVNRLILIWPNKNSFPFAHFSILSHTSCSICIKTCIQYS